ncbi:HAD-IIIA family hydrolase [Actinomadura sp. KC345]|uniref:D-glycero-alpha-D-manno-heptose-1,7-bisphosphate 7-phosphatase n=1 Tax=Actinomadura sp. KC345 TaxID=2530371 RepID=UPI001404D227|nr:HAD-IIIA family hydrolase [Actinomadura sp. KC345]
MTEGLPGLAFDLVLLDRDGVLNRDLARGVRHQSDWEWLPEAREAVRMLSESGTRMMVVTNQANIGRGLLARAELNAIHRRMIDGLRPVRFSLDDVFACPHTPDDGCLCRKPRPGMILAALKRAQVRPDRTLLIGDQESDIAAAQAAGCWAIHVRSGKGDPPEDARAGHLGSACDLLSVVRSLHGSDRPGTARPNQG